jgi:amino-acid N-acetyltransferase
LHWPNFIVAADHSNVIGTVQLRKHKDGARELGSLAVAHALRGKGIARQMIDALLAGHAGPVHMITAARYAEHYQHWGFSPVPVWRAPLCVVFNFCMGNLAGWISRLKGRARRRLVILRRAPRIAR